MTIWLLELTQLLSYVTEQKKRNWQIEVSISSCNTTLQPNLTPPLLPQPSGLSIYPICVSTRTNLWVLPGNRHALIHLYNPPQISRCQLSQLSRTSDVQEASALLVAKRRTMATTQNNCFFLSRSKWHSDIGAITFSLFQSTLVGKK